MGEKRNVYRLLVGRPEGKRPLRRPKHSWVDHTKMDFDGGGVVWLRIGISAELL
jgi:hypothetical protein